MEHEDKRGCLGCGSGKAMGWSVGSAHGRSPERAHTSKGDARLVGQVSL